MLQLDLLGPLALRRDHATLPLAIKKTQALLALLARSGGLPRARIVALLWPTLDESTGRRNLRRELARLRELGAADALKADGDTLALAADVDCDSRRFESALAEGRADDALVLWRGPPADGLHLDDAAAFDDWWAAQAEQLQALRRRALAASAAVHEQRGDLERALELVQQMLADDPLQEHLHRDVMRLLARSGRREAALAQFERCERLLAGELGLAPMAETLALARSLRDAGAAAAALAPAAAGASAMAPAAADRGRQTAVHGLRLPDTLPFVGRAAEVVALEAAWAAGRAVVIEGEGGVGKSRLALEFAAAHGPHALAQARAADAVVPYAAFTRALRAMAGPAPDLAGLPEWVRTDLARLLPELGAPPPPLREAAEQARFVEACVQGWLALGAESFDAVILDDWHLADTASVELLGFVAQRRVERAMAAPRELLVLRPALEPAARAALERLVRATQGLHLALAPLPADAVFDLLRLLSGAEAPRLFSRRLARATGGNPFFLAETLRHLAEAGMLSADADGAWRTPFDESTDDYGELPVPASVLDAVRERMQALAEAPRRMLEVAALAGEPFTPALLAGAAALSELDALLAIEQAVGAQLLREHESGGFAFAHDLVQQAIEGGLGATRRRLVHRRLAIAAAAAGAEPVVVATHHEAAGEPARAVAWRLAAGEVAQRLHARPQAVAHWEQGLADGPTLEQEAQLRRALVSTLHVMDLAERCAGHAAALLALLPRLPEPMRSAALLDVAEHLAITERAPEALALLDDLAPASHLAPGVAAKASRLRATALRETGAVAEARELLRQAAANPELTPDERMPLLSELMLAEQTAGRTPAALERADEYLALARRRKDELAESRGLLRRGTLLVEMGEHRRAEADLQASAAMLGRFGHVGLMRNALFSLCCLRSAQSRPAEVLAAARQGWEAEPPMALSELRLMYRLAFVDAHLALGELGAAWEHALGAVDDTLAVGEPYATLCTCMTCHELFALLDAEDRLHPLLVQLSTGTLRQMPGPGTEAWLARAQAALMHQRTAEAAALLDDLSGDHPDPRVRARHAIARAQCALAQGDASATLQALPADDHPGLNPEMRLRSLAVRAEAQARSGGVAPTTLDVARQALDEPSGPAHPPHALAALLLRRALQVAGHETAADRAALQELAATLAGHPAEQAAFLRRWL
jgi:DNA-binding SARP family transcriptional activator